MVATATAQRKPSLIGRTLYIPRMDYAGARLLAAVFRSIGIDAEMAPASDERTLELGGLYSCGEECYPQKITLGDFLKLVESPGFEPSKAAFFMPIADGPCRFGQYAPYLRQVLEQIGAGEVLVFSPSSADSYEGIGAHATDMIRTTWHGLVVADLLRKFLLSTRPYETRPGDADAVFEESLGRVEKIIETPNLPHKVRLGRLAEALAEARDRFRSIPAKYTKDRPLIGVVGEIFCRLHTFSNEDACRKIEQQGGEAWLSDVSEWVWYTNWWQLRRVRKQDGVLSRAMLRTLLKNYIQRSDEHVLLDVVAEDLRGYEEPHDINEVLEAARPYLPPLGALGEMVLSVGKAIYLYRKGADGIIDISPFSCMNGITCEAVYPAVSRDHDGIPIRSFYFDTTHSNMNRDLDIFLELARSYRQRKKIERVYPAVFG